MREDGKYNMSKQLILSITLSFIVGFVMINPQKASSLTTEPTIQLEEAVTPHTIYIPIIVKGLQADFWNPVKLGAERAARDYGVEITFEGTQGEGQIEEQLDIIREALTRNPQAIALSAVDSRAVTPYLESARTAGIPVIGLDSGVDSPIIATTVATDNYAAGVFAAEKMAELLKSSGQVAIIVQDQTSRVAGDRRDGFIDTITQRYPEMKIVAIRYGGGRVDESAELTKKIIKEYPNIAGIFGGNEGSAHGVIKGIKELGKEGEILIIGFDSGKVLLDAIREGVVAGAITQNPIGMGYQTVETALRAIRGERLPPFIDTGITWYDRMNIDNPEIRQLLYE